MDNYIHLDNECGRRDCCQKVWHRDWRGWGAENFSTPDIALPDKLPRSRVCQRVASKAWHRIQRLWHITDRIVHQSDHLSSDIVVRKTVADICKVVWSSIHSNNSSGPPISSWVPKLSYKQGVNPEVRPKVQKHSVFIEFCRFEDICDNLFLPDAFVDEGSWDVPGGTWWLDLKSLATCKSTNPLSP